ncbi:hydroxyacylglutathione hydrolase-like protein isoform X2 [Nothoprocta perdicaria]|uniref:hydroxyacylglutathione hydrolase-like protein isoform X2 n=1 Tax=Nothoprocta perdicaria TaxID=30464 RepID=UPI000E1BECCA|nr:hydroxyacylglutathione hydrolase-like protein isoform X2 [Nothoprocta perdicaria]
MKVKVIPVLEDNYMYLLIEERSRDAVAVDAAVPKRLLDIVRREAVELRALLTTHHHWDHARGNEELARLCPGLRVFGADERIGGLTHPVTHGQELAFGSIRVRCLRTPGHTSGHVCYFAWEDESPDAPALFSGDALPRDTKVFCGHECTVRNLKFALKVEPDNEAAKQKLAWAKRRDDDDVPTVPSTLHEEFLYNPFLRLTEEPVQRFTGHTEPLEVLRSLRAEHESFRRAKERPPPQATLALQWGLFGPLLEKK